MRKLARDRKAGPKPDDNLVNTERRATNNVDPGSPIMAAPSRSSQAPPNLPA
jgi:hypothetical protein